MRRSKAEVGKLYYRDKEEHMRKEENCNTYHIYLSASARPCHIFPSATAFVSPLPYLLEGQHEPFGPIVSIQMQPLSIALF